MEIQKCQMMIIKSLTNTFLVKVLCKWTLNMIYSVMNMAKTLFVLKL